MNVSSENAENDLDSKIGHWIDGVPYIWISHGTLKTSYRYYFANVDDQVYVPNSEGMNMPYKMYLIEFKTREKKFSPDREILRIPLSTDVTRVRNLFRVYNPYVELVPADRVRHIQVRINGRTIDPTDALVPEVRQLYDHHLYHEPLYLRYQKSIPPAVCVLKYLLDDRRIKIEF